MTGRPDDNRESASAGPEGLSELEHLLGPARRAAAMGETLPVHEDLEAVAVASLGLASAPQREHAVAVLRANPGGLLEALVDPRPGEEPEWAPLPVAPEPAVATPQPKRAWWEALADWLGRWQTSVAWGVAFASSVLLLVAAVQLWRGTGDAGEAAGGHTPDIRRLGGPTDAPPGLLAQRVVGDSLSVLVDRPNAAGELRSLAAVSGQRLEDADQLRLSYSAKRSGRLSLVWVDGAGSVTVLRPGELAPSAEISAGEDRPLEPALRVTPGTGCEWLVAVFSDQPLQPEYLTLALQHAPRPAEACSLELADLPGARHVEVMAFRRQ